MWKKSVLVLPLLSQIPVALHFLVPQVSQAIQKAILHSQIVKEGDISWTFFLLTHLSLDLFGKPDQNFCFVLQCQPTQCVTLLMMIKQLPCTDANRRYLELFSLTVLLYEMPAGLQVQGLCSLVDWWAFQTVLLCSKGWDCIDPPRVCFEAITNTYFYFSDCRKRENVWMQRGKRCIGKLNNILNFGLVYLDFVFFKKLTSSHGPLQ